MSYWPPEIAHRVPPEFPPAWASAWGDDAYGLWADLTVQGHGLNATQRMRWIEPGEFQMGSTQKERDAIKDSEGRKWANDNESIPREVKIALGFWLANTPCTQAFFQAVTGQNSSHFKYNVDSSMLPADSVSFDLTPGASHVLRFLQQLNGKLPQPCAELPSEAEWEYACRAGTQTAYWWGDAFDPSKANINHTDSKNRNSKLGTTLVDKYPPNPWGLHDMHGNVWEWCADALDSPSKDTTQIQNHFSYSQRGGGWIASPSRARSAYRFVRATMVGSGCQGLRFALRSPIPVPDGGSVNAERKV